MKELIDCKLNTDIACMKLKLSNGGMIAIDTLAVDLLSGEFYFLH